VRFKELVLRMADDELRMRFHDRLTVLSGLGAPERQAMADSLLGALAGGTNGSTELAYVLADGRRVVVTRQRDGVASFAFDDGSRAPDAALQFGVDVRAVHDRCHVRADHLGLTIDDIGPEPPALVEARDTLRFLREQLESALAAKRTVDAMTAELAEIDRLVRDADDARARRRYARLLSDLDRVRAEAAALAGGAAMARADDRLIEHGPAVLDTDDRWRAAAAERAECEARGATSSHVARPEPSHPAVARLASADQDALWSAARRVADSARRFEHERLALGGLGTGATLELVDALDRAHEKVEAAERRLADRRLRGLVTVSGAAAVSLASIPVVPVLAPAGLTAGLTSVLWSLVRPNRQLARARAAEAALLERAQAPTYLAFHLRRIEPIIDPRARDELELARTEHALARDGWRELAGALDPVEALALEAETRAYAVAVEATEGCPPGITIEDAIAREEALRHELDVQLCALGFGSDGDHDNDGALAARAENLRVAIDDARRRDAARAAARDRAVVEAELAALEERARAERRPEWGNSLPTEVGDEPDVESLTRRRAHVHESWETAARLVPDIDALADRCAAVERRVAVIEASVLGETSAAASTTSEEIEHRLLARVVAARAAGEDGEALPVILDEPLARLRGAKKLEVLDLIERLADKTQLVYLTDDPDVVTWARRRAASSSLSLLEPVPDAEVVVL
jgi:hypothetical protein